MLVPSTRHHHDMELCLACREYANSSNDYAFKSLRDVNGSIMMRSNRVKEFINVNLATAFLRFSFLLHR